MISFKGIQISISLRRDNKQVFERIPVLDIKPNPYQPRKSFSHQSLEELSNSIKENGLIHPITVRKNTLGGYELVAGERRLRAAKMAGLEDIPAMVISGDEMDLAIMAMVENLQREDLHYLEEAKGYAALIHDHGLTQEELAKKVGKSQSTIANKIRLLRLSEEIKEMLVVNRLTERHARALLRLPDDDLRKKALKRIIDRNLNVKDTEAYIEKILQRIQRSGKEPLRKTKINGHMDFRIYINTIKHAVGMMKDYGITPQIKEVVTEESIEIIVTIPKAKVFN